MIKRIILIVPLLLSTQFCHARALTLAEANTINTILLFVLALLLALGAFGLYHNKVISRRNEQLHRILNALDDYRAIMANRTVTLDELEEALKQRQPKVQAKKSVTTDGSKAYYVKMDARVNKEKPFTDPDFDQQALADFMGVDIETFRKLVPRYSEPDRTLEYINSLRAEYAAKILMEHPDCPIDDTAGKCGFKDTKAFVSTFKFAFGVTPTDYLNSMAKMFKKNDTAQ